MKLYARIKWELLMYMAENGLTDDDMWKGIQRLTVLALGALIGILVVYFAVMWIGSVL